MTSFLDQEIDIKAENYLNDYADQLTNDTPTIEVAIKNLIAVLLSKCLHPHDFKTNDDDDDDDDSNSVSNIVFEPTVVIKCAKIIVKAINEIELSNPLEWSMSLPQEENQTAGNRLDQIAQYKVAYHLVNKMKTFNNDNTPNQKSGKIYKLFGRKMLQWTYVWNGIKERVISENNGDIDNKVLIYFLDSFSHSIHNKNIDKQNNHGDSDYLRNDQELIWCSNFNALLVKRQEHRRHAAQDRLQQQQLKEYDEDEENDDDDEENEDGLKSLN